MNKNRLIVWLAMSFFAIMPMMAQLGEVRNNLAIGINGGLNMSQVEFSPSIKQTNKNGMVLGVTARYMSEKYFNMLCGIQVELNYSQRGWNEKIEDGSENTYSRTMNYLEVPFLAHLAFGKDAIDSGVQHPNLWTTQHIKPKVRMQGKNAPPITRPWQRCGSVITLYRNE